MVVATTSFAELARMVAAQMAFADARIVVVEHPLGGADEAGVRSRAESAVEPALAQFTRRG